MQSMVNYRDQQSSRYHVRRTPAVVHPQYLNEFQHFHSTRDVHLQQSSEKVNRMRIERLPAGNKFIRVASAGRSLRSLVDDESVAMGVW